MIRFDQRREERGIRRSSKPRRRELEQIRGCDITTTESATDVDNILSNLSKFRSENLLQFVVHEEKIQLIKVK